MTESSGTTVMLSEIDTKHLAQQALKLFAKRYGKLYDTALLMTYADKTSDSISFSDYENVVKKSYGSVMTKQQPTGESRVYFSDCLARVWLEYEYTTRVAHPWSTVNRQQCIKLCSQGYHSKDSVRVEKLRAAVKNNCAFHFDIIDADSDGQINLDEYYAYCAKFGVHGNLKGTFEALDLNGDGVITHSEMNTCYEGFHFSVEEERYNHVMGVISD